MTSDKPRSLRSEVVVRERRAMLDLPHIAPLRDYACTLRAEGRGSVPDFDSMDGGVGAAVLFLMEKPGPMTDGTAVAGRIGSGFISRNNDDPTAEATFRFMATAGIDRQRSVTWNTVPWWNGTRAVTRDELKAGIERLVLLFELLPNLRVIVSVGSKARKASSLAAARGLPFLASAHPSPINRASRPAVWKAIPQQWAQALCYMTE